MSVSSAKEHWPNRGASFGVPRESAVRRHWVVKTNNKWDDAGVIKQHFIDSLGIALYVPHPNPNLQNFLFRTLDCDPRTETPTVWDVVGNYSSEPIDEEEQEQNDNPNPTLRPTVIEWDSELSQEFTGRDKNGKAMLNSAGDAFESIEKDDVRWRIIVQKCFANVPGWVVNFVNKVNSSAITVDGQTLDARTCKLQRLSIPRRQVENGISFVEVTAEIAYRSDTWDVYRLDEGFNALDRVGARYKILIQDENGEMREPTEPVPLDGEGSVLITANEDTAVFRHFKIYNEADFNDLPF